MYTQWSILILFLLIACLGVISTINSYSILKLAKYEKRLVSVVFESARCPTNK